LVAAQRKAEPNLEDDDDMNYFKSLANQE
jgi:hypothetical protein